MYKYHFSKNNNPTAAKSIQLKRNLLCLICHKSFSSLQDTLSSYLRQRLTHRKNRLRQHVLFYFKYSSTTATKKLTSVVNRGQQKTVVCSNSGTQQFYSATTAIMQNNGDFVQIPLRYSRYLTPPKSFSHVKYTSSVYLSGTKMEWNGTACFWFNNFYFISFSVLLFTCLPNTSQEWYNKSWHLNNYITRGENHISRIK